MSTGATLDRAAHRIAVAAAVGLLLAACSPAVEVEPPSPDAAPHAADRPVEPVPLEVAPGQAIERPISPGEAHDYRLDLADGEFFEVQVEQLGVDVGLSLFDPRDELTLEVDLPIADLGREPLLGVAEQTGSYRLRVEAWESEDDGDSYRITVAARRPAAELDRLRARAAQVFYRGEQLSWSREYRQALAPYREALELWREAGDEFWHAETLDAIGNTYRMLGESGQAVGFHRRAVESFEELGEKRFVAVSSNHLAIDYYNLGEMERAIRQYSETLELQRQLGDRHGQGLSLGALADIYKIRGETQKALDHFESALETLDRSEDRRYRAAALHNLGTLFRRLGRRKSALEHLWQAEGIYAELNDSRRQASSLSQIGQLVFESGDAEEALRILGRSLALRRQRKDRRGEAVALRKIGSVLLFKGDVEGARAHFLEALERLGDLESPRSEAAVLTELGDLHNQLGQSEVALDYHRRALEIHGKVGDPVAEAGGLLGVAISERGRGRLDAALAAGERALEILETLRLKPFSEELRLSFFATVQRFFDFYVDLLMELDRVEPGAGHSARALAASERARARSLLDLLSEAGAEIRDDTAPNLLADERAMQRQLNLSVELMEDEEASERQRAAAAGEVQKALRRLDGIRAAIRRQSPRYADLTQPEILDADEIQARVLDRDTVLLEYRLGRERSFLWLMTSDELVSFDLAPAAEIEEAVRRAHALLQRGPRRESEGQTRALLCRLSQMLLRPVGDRLRGKRLAIVADGALEYLPFAALPNPDSVDECSEPLVVAHEIVHLPSASTLAVLRREGAQRRSPAGTIAVFADPVFSVDDARVDRRGAPAAASTVAATVSRGPETTAQGSFRRLPHSRAEAEAILGLVPADRALRALDFDASKQEVLSGRLADYRIVHFATHGVLNAEQPALSGLVLSQVDPRGKPVEGRLHSHEIYNLRLPADLVVLGGCETALGKEVRGEGLVGLTRGFMYAGALRVMVSLWKVSDHGTADLMEIFYRNLLERDLAPSAALRRAQLEVRSMRPQPFYWAGFVVQGDWRGRVPPD